MKVWYIERRCAQETCLQDSGIHTEHFAQFFWKCTKKNEIIISSYSNIGKWAIGLCNSIQYGALKEQSMPAARRHINWWSQGSACTQCIYWRKGLPRKDSALISHQARRKKYKNVIARSTDFRVRRSFQMEKTFKFRKVITLLNLL